MGIFGRIQEIIETQVSSGDLSPPTNEELLIELQNQLKKVSNELVTLEKEMLPLEQQRERYENQLLKWTHKAQEFLNDQKPNAIVIKALENRDYYQWHVNDLTNTLRHKGEYISTLQLQVTKLEEGIMQVKKQQLKSKKSASN